MFAYLKRRARNRRTWIGGAVALVLVGILAPQAWAYHNLRIAHRELALYHPERARDHLESCLRIWPDHASARLLASRAARESGDFDEADRQLRLAQQLSGSNEETAFEWALLQAAIGNVREVDSYLQKQADQHPEASHLVWEVLAEGYLRLYLLQDARLCLDHWLQGDPDNVRALELRGRTFATGRGVKRGADDYRRSLELDPTRDNTRVQFTRALLNIGGYDEALPHLELLVKNRPDDPDLGVLLARCLNMLDQKERARQTLEASLKKHPDHGMTYRTLGQFALTESKEEKAASEAEVWLRRAAELLPNDYQSQWLLYDSLRRQGKPEAPGQLKTAEQVRDRSERLGELQSRKLGENPLDPALQVEMAKLLMRNGHTEVAVQWLQSALALDPSFRPAHAALADYYAIAGRPDLAAEHRRLATAEEK